jgi:hypothetical protein
VASLRNWFEWRRLLASCTYDPRADAKSENLSGRDFLIVGCPRSGTSLLAAQLFRPPKVVTCMEPWDGMRMPVAELMRSLHAELESGMLGRGRLDVDALDRSGVVRWIRDGEQRFPITAGADVRLGVKWPAFWRYLPLLDRSRFLVCVRHPADVMASFVHTGGRLAQGLEYDIVFNRDMNRWLRRTTRQPAVRRALMWEYINSRLVPFLDRANVKVVRYERWFADPEVLLGEVGDFLGVELSGSRVDLQRPEPRADEETSRLVREYCPTASVLGYEV